MLNYCFCASPSSHVPDSHVDCAGMPWGHRWWPLTAASSTEDHPAEGGCCIDRRLIVVDFINSRRQRRTPRRPHRSPGNRRRRRTPGRARRRGRRGWFGRQQCCGTSKIRKSRSGPLFRQLPPPALRLSTPVAIGSGRPWCGGLPLPPGTRGGATRPCLSFSLWRALAVCR